MLPCSLLAENIFPLCNTSSDAETFDREVRIENDSDRKFSKSNKVRRFSLRVECQKAEKVEGRGPGGGEG